MMMESPVRISLSAILLLYIILCGFPVNGNTLALETTTTAIKEERSARNARINGTSWLGRYKQTPDVALNELHSKSSELGENVDKRHKNTNRGRVKFSSQLKSTTKSPVRKVRGSTEVSNIIVVTPTPEVKKPAQIIDSMRHYKKNKMSLSSTSTASSITIKKNVEALTDKSEKEEENDEDEDDEEENDDESEDDDEEDKEANESESFEKYTKNDFTFNDFFTIPSYNYSYNSYKDPSENKLRQVFNGPSYDSYSSYIPKFDYGSDEKESFKTGSFFDFDSKLTTPKNDYFDNKFKEISTSIIKNLKSIAHTSPVPNATNVKILQEKLSNGNPKNGSTVIIQNTKEYRVSDNEKAGTDKKELSDIHGTSIYYEMSVLSTETYNLNQNEDDCDGDTLSSQPTVSTSSEEELASVKTTQATILPRTSNPVMNNVVTEPEALNKISSTFLPYSSPSSSIFPYSGIAVSTQNSVSSTTQKSTRLPSFNNRSRNYSKRLNFTGKYDTNSLSQKTDEPPLYLQTSRKFHFTTPKNKRVWMNPTRNVTKTASRPTPPTTIYSEHFNIKNKIRPTYKSSNKTYLTTVSSDIDPVLQSEISGIKKIVHSQLISDNTIPSLSKRGSTKFISSTATSLEIDTQRYGIDENDMEIPPTSTAWALASLISPPSSAISVVNITGSIRKSVDENELQRVGEVVDKKTTTTTTTTYAPVTTNVFNFKNITEIVQNILPSRASYIPTAASYEISSSSNDQTKLDFNEVKTESLEAESSITHQNSKQVLNSTEPTNLKFANITTNNKTKPSWLQKIEGLKKSTTEKSQEETTTEKIQLVDATKSTGFESITKFPSGVTTPLDETIVSSEQELNKNNTLTNDTNITTVRFPYETTETSTIDDIDSSKTTTDVWHPMIPTRTKRPSLDNIPITTYRPITELNFITTIKPSKENVPITSYKTNTDEIDITTYRPQYITTANMIDETTIISETTSKIEVSSQFVNVTETVTELTQKPLDEISTEITTTSLSTNTEISSDIIEIATTTLKETTTELPEETTKIVVEVVTEINTEKITNTVTPTDTITTTDHIETSSEQKESSSEENSGSNDVIEQDSTKTPLSSTPTSTSTTFKSTTTMSTTTTSTTEAPTTIISIETTIRSTTEPKLQTTNEPTEENWQEITTHVDDKIIETTTNVDESTDETTTDNKSRDNLENLTTISGDMTTESLSRVSPASEDTGSGAAVAIAVSTIGVIALILLIGLLLLVRRRGRRGRGVYAQRCTPVSLDAYSLDSVSVGGHPHQHQHRKGTQSQRPRLRASKRSYGNPAYDDEVTSHPMLYAALANFALDVDSMTAEFAEIPSVTVRPDEVPPGCEDKNRYSNVLPLPETRVPLARIGNDPTTEYINANYITGPGNIRNYYIACQAPLQKTVCDFWRMMWEQNSRVLVMLTEYMENGVEKCYEYLPPSEISDNKRTFGEFQIILKKREQKDKYAISTVQLINLSTRTWRELTHLWYFWPAKGVPEDYDSIIDFLSEMRIFMKISQTAKEYDEEGVEVIYGDQKRASFNNLAKLKSDDSSSGNGVNVYSPAKAEEMMKKGATNGTLSRMKAASEIDAVRPCTVVCASGAGRAPALIALDICARALAAGAGTADVPRVVRELRAQRPHSLSNKHHYIFLYKVLSEYGNKLMGGGVDTI